MHFRTYFLVHSAGLGSDAELLEDYRGRSLLVFSSWWAIDFTVKRNPGLVLSEIVVAER